MLFPVFWILDTDQQAATRRRTAHAERGERERPGVSLSKLSLSLSPLCVRVLCVCCVCAVCVGCVGCGGAGCVGSGDVPHPYSPTLPRHPPHSPYNCTAGILAMQCKIQGKLVRFTNFAIHCSNKRISGIRDVIYNIQNTEYGICPYSVRKKSKKRCCFSVWDTVVL